MARKKIVGHGQSEYKSVCVGCMLAYKYPILHPRFSIYLHEIVCVGLNFGKLHRYWLSFMHHVFFFHSCPTQVNIGYIQNEIDPID